MTIIKDLEFGDITVRRMAKSRHVRIRVATDGRYVATAPTYTPVYFIKRVIQDSRDELRKLAAHTSHHMPYLNGQQIGKSHQLAVISTGMVSAPEASVQRQRIVIKLPHGTSAEQSEVQQLIRDTVAKVLRKEAKAYLPKRLKYLADQHGFTYERVRFSHSGGRWGSCSSSGTISLNIALMKLPHELIDYVLIHELCHTRQMNHSPAFWQEVAAYDPLFKLHKQLIKRETPSV
jgi:predicted metal-dependent hydrolase